MQRICRWWRYAVLLGSSAVLLQTSGCAIDSATMTTLLTQVLTQVLTESLQSGLLTTSCTA
jgi:hypothetical protein